MRSNSSLESFSILQVAFTLIEGGRAYVLFKALAADPDFDPSAAGAEGATVVSLLVKTRELLRYASDLIAEAEIDLFYRDHTGGMSQTPIAPRVILVLRWCWGR